jgi:DNA-binding IclR family transcriptional regulator
MATASSSTVVKAFHVLLLFRSHPLLGAAECARLLAVPRASAHRMLVSLKDAGALEVSQKGQYRLTLRIFELGLHVPEQRFLFDAAYLPMERLVTLTKLSAHLAVREGTQLLYIAKLRHAPDRTKARAGQRNSLHATAIGKVLLSGAPKEALADVLGCALTRYTPYTVTSHERLLAQLQRVRQEGFAYDREERTMGLVSIAVPIPDGRGAAVAALSLLAPAEKYGGPRLERLKRDLVRTQGEITRGLHASGVPRQVGGRDQARSKLRTAGSAAPVWTS